MEPFTKTQLTIMRTEACENFNKLSTAITDTRNPPSDDEVIMMGELREFAYQSMSLLDKLLTK
jgi:hypothetical protein